MGFKRKCLYILKKFFYQFFFAQVLRRVSFKSNFPNTTRTQKFFFCESWPANHIHPNKYGMDLYDTFIDIKDQFFRYFS